MGCLECGHDHADHVGVVKEPTDRIRTPHIAETTTAGNGVCLRLVEPAQLGERRRRCRCEGFKGADDAGSEKR